MPKYQRRVTPQIFVLGGIIGRPGKITFLSFQGYKAIFHLTVNFFYCNGNSNSL